MRSTIRRIARRFERSIRMRGLWGSITHVLRSLVRSLGSTSSPLAAEGGHSDHFDRKFGTDTGGVIPQADLDVEGANWVHGSAYVATSPIDFGEVLAPFALDYARTSFVDLGCGKGRVILMAAALPFASIIGVEYSPALSAIARDNIARFTGPRAAAEVRVVTCDASAFTFPEGDLVVFMYHPFDEVVMQRVVDALASSMEAMPRRLVVLYFKPVHAALWRSAGFVEPRHASGLYDAYVGGVLRAAPSQPFGR